MFAMRFDVLTIFPEFYESPLRASILGRALEAGQVACRIHNIRDWAAGRHQTTDDTPYGGGGGMVMLADPRLAAIRAVRAEAAAELGERPPLVYLSPRASRLAANLVAELAVLPARSCFRPLTRGSTSASPSWRLTARFRSAITC